MAMQETVLIGEPVLRLPATPVALAGETSKKVANFNDEVVKNTVVDLIDTMRQQELAGMAAPQIRVSLAIFVTEIRETKYRSGETDELRIYINPEIVKLSHETELGWEGCGSIPGLFGQVERAKEIAVNYCDKTGVSREITANGLLARVIQHEIDHLNGILFTDLADPKTFVSREYYLEHIKES